MDRHHVQAEEQILPKAFLAHHVGQVLIRGGDHPGVGVDGLRAADAHDDLFFQHAEELRLAAEAQVADFIEKQRAAGSELELAGARFVGIGERPFLVAEEFAFEQGFRERRAVHGDKRLISARA